MHVSKCRDTVTIEIDTFILFFFEKDDFTLESLTIENKFCFLQLISYNKKKAINFEIKS